MPTTKTETKQVMIRLPEDLLAWLREEAELDDRSFNSQCRAIFRHYQKTRESARQEPTNGAIVN